MSSIPLITVVTSEKPLVHEITILNTLLEKGLECLWLRKPGCTIDYLQTIISDIGQEFHDRILLPYRLWKYWNGGNAYGFHLTEKERITISEKELENILTSGYRLSTSVHTIKDWKLLPTYFSQAFVSPVFDSVSKVGYLANLDIGSFVNYKTATIPIALGGVTPENITNIFSMGFEGTAVLGAIWQSKNPINTWEKLNRIVTSVQ